VTTRNTPNLLNSAERQYVTLSLLKSEYSRHDVKNFVSDSLEALLATKYHDLSSAKLQAVKNLIVKRACSMFL